MKYINNPNTKIKTYDEIVSITITHGVEPKRVYLYLAMMGVTSTLARIIDSNGGDYLEPTKVAIKNNQYVIGVRECGECGHLIFETMATKQAATNTDTYMPSGDVAFDNWALMSANEYRSIDYAYSICGLNMPFDEFTELFLKHYKKNDSGRYIKV
jgi:hypothetical protein